MKIHEYQAKQLFREYGVPVPAGAVAFNAGEAEEIYTRFGGVVAIKAQVHAGGRGKAGGVKLAHSPEEARHTAEAILGMTIKGSVVRKVLVEQGADIAGEAYLGLIVDRAEKSISFLCSSEGGIEIEEVAATSPEKILRAHAYGKTFPEAEAAAIAERLFPGQDAAEEALDIMRRLFRLFVEKDSSLAEINPLVLTGEGHVLALDGKINFDDNALFRRPEIEALRDPDEENPRELEARKHGLSYVQLDGNIGCMVNGAGLAMATMDAIQFFGGKPANFLDVGGSSNPEKVVHAFRLILGGGHVQAVLINIFGGITRCDDIANGILEARERMEESVPIVVRLTGTNAEEGLAILKGTPLIPAASLAEGVRKAIELARA